MKRQRNKRQDDRAVTLGDMLNEEMIQQLKDTKKTLTNEEKDRQKAEEERKHQERKEREKNKSFEELLGESELDWKKFK